ncbi:precorrin-3B C(17)-methyltransferase [Methanoplanus endosymbiosus]|uniref:Precorrin-3B C(17)-methyltransferase n=1 Tax=Methanoplanus endosymbiosus TaxID=33865 RepID=A0A9E7PPS6_9EURY|nr:precorrin-3B C(17)-methyltransferase [Methanoplanus endosymbiosus]UUX92829.1 precorrin-3B C(17)-methyltransferase [Methanoplanus endosymbiosus]
MQSSNRGKLFIIGIGPGNTDFMIKRASDAIRESDIIIGNDFYLNLIKPLVEDKEVIYSSMGKEVERARRCIELAEKKKVAMISGGDPGIYGMAGIVIEIIKKDSSGVDYEVIPGVTAATAAASRTGSPLSGDYTTISLSDLLTPLEVIEKRLDLAFQMGVPVVLYNPKSNGRPHNLAMALGTALKYKSGDTPVAVVKNSHREGEEIRYYTLAELFEDDGFVDMRSVVTIGGEESEFIGEGEDISGIITPRGYDRKYVY